MGKSRYALDRLDDEDSGPAPKVAEHGLPLSVEEFRRPAKRMGDSQDERFPTALELVDEVLGRTDRAYRARGNAIHGYDVLEKGRIEPIPDALFHRTRPLPFSL